MIFWECSSLVFTHRVIWLKFWGVMLALNSLICTMALRIVAHASRMVATNLGSSKIPQGTWQCPPRSRKTKWRVASFWMSEKQIQKMNERQTTRKQCLEKIGLDQTKDRARKIQRWAALRCISLDRAHTRSTGLTVVWKSTAIFELFTSENETLLIRWDTFFILDLGFDIFNRVRWFDIQGNGFTS